MPNVVADIFRQAAALNRDDPRRNGNVLEIEPGCEVLATGDIHGCRPNFAKIVEFAALARFAQRRLVLQEIIHGPIDPDSGHDRSIELLLRAARLKLADPMNVLFVLGNHDLAQATENEISKHGHGVCKTFKAGVEFSLGQASAQEVMPAVCEFLLSAPLAVRCPNGAFITHSLPSPARMALAGVDILSAAGYAPQDLRRGGSAYEWTWGRGQTPQQVEQLAGQLDASFFIVGHKHIHTGFEPIGSRAVILASDHAAGCIMQFASDGPLTPENAVSFIRPIARLSDQP